LLHKPPDIGMMGRVIGSRWLPIVLGAGLLAAASCMDSGYQFVENDEFGIYAKVPDDWTVYRSDEVLAAVSGASSEEATSDRLEPRVWLNTFDASDDPSPAGALELGADEPRGSVRVFRLTREERNQINLSTMRGAIIGTDPITASSQSAMGGGQEVQVLVDEPAEFDGGYHGVHTVFVASRPTGGVAVVDQTALLDSTSSVLVLFVVSCDEDCYFETSRDEINEIVDSWAIEEARS
jgi:hypothetical protein